MGFGNTCISLVFAVTVLGLNIPVFKVTPDKLVQVDRNQVLAQTNIAQIESPPDYQGTPPPPGGDPLPPERLRREVQPLPKDFRVPALQPDYTGDLWVGSWLGLARI
ncbi:MAG TPA: transcriptional regulator, partial [Cyanobacteria bacterium UBA11148]|nr:transcriptional regulator [Cyanobacteria bacterium UBA11148]